MPTPYFSNETGPDVPSVCPVPSRVSVTPGGMCSLHGRARPVWSHVALGLSPSEEINTVVSRVQTYTERVATLNPSSS